MNKIKENIKAFILDLDGIITETSEYHYQGWKSLAEEEGIDFSRKDNEKLRGVSRRQSLEILLGEREVSEK
ncbi:MAG: HAD hydrolase-like protein, partial [Bacillota bacterium]